MMQERGAELLRSEVIGKRGFVQGCLGITGGDKDGWNAGLFQNRPWIYLAQECQAELCPVLCSPTGFEPAGESADPQVLQQFKRA